jgi:TRAP-type C4-dicarboxylate transport system permease small subunit
MEGVNFMTDLEKKIFRPIIGIQKGVLIITSACAVLMLVINTLDRYFFHIGLFGLEEIIIVIIMWLYWFAGMQASFEASHIKGDVVNVFVKSPKGRTIVALIAQGLTVFGLYFWMRWGLDYFEWITGRGRGFTQGLRMPMLTSQLPLVIGFCAMFLYSVYHFIKTLLSCIRLFREGNKEEIANPDETKEVSG